MKINNFCTFSILSFVFIYFFLFLKYIFFIIKVYVEDEIFFWKYSFLVENLKITLIIYAPYFFINLCVFFNQKQKGNLTKKKLSKELLKEINKK